MTEPNYRQSTTKEIQAITRPGMVTLIHRYRNIGLSDYALSLPIGHSLPDGAFQVPTNPTTPYEVEQTLIVNLMCAAYLQGYNRRYFDASR